MHTVMRFVRSALCGLFSVYRLLRGGPNYTETRRPPASFAVVETPAGGA